MQIITLLIPINAGDRSMSRRYVNFVLSCKFTSLLFKSTHKKTGYEAIEKTRRDRLTA